MQGLVRGFTSCRPDENLDSMSISLTAPSRVRSRRIVSFIFLVAALSGLIPGSKSQLHASDQPGSGTAATPVIVVHAKRYYFSPAAITVKKGQTVKLVLIADDVRHGLAVKGLGIRADMQKGQRTEIMVTPTQTGDFPGGCSVYCGSGHRDMEFVIHVVD